MPGVVQENIQSMYKYGCVRSQRWEGKEVRNLLENIVEEGIEV